MSAGQPYLTASRNEGRLLCSDPSFSPVIESRNRGNEELENGGGDDRRPGTPRSVARPPGSIPGPVRSPLGYRASVSRWVVWNRSPCTRTK